MQKTKIYKFIIAVLICQAVGIIGSFFTTSAIGGWYKNLNKPLFSHLFAPRAVHYRLKVV